jgi:hypothetical protein
VRESKSGKPEFLNSTEAEDGFTGGVMKDTKPNETGTRAHTSSAHLN